MKSCPECGAILEKPRSRPQNNRLHALVDAAWMHWRNRNFNPKNREHLRYYLEMQAGHFDVVKTIRVASVPAEKLADLLTAVLRTSDDERLFVEADADLIVVRRVKSISFSKLAHKDACKLFDEISEVLEAEGFDPEQLLKETANAA